MLNYVKLCKLCMHKIKANKQASKVMQQNKIIYTFLPLFDFHQKETGRTENVGIVIDNKILFKKKIVHHATTNKITSWTFSSSSWKFQVYQG